MSFTTLGLHDALLKAVTDSGYDTATEVQTQAIPSAIAGHDLTCFGAADGSTVVTYSGGTPGYTVLWSNGLTADSIAGLSAGSYTATITDANGCTSTQTTNLVQPAQIVTGTSTTAVSCNGGLDGCAIVTASGGPSGAFSGSSSFLTATAESRQ